MNVNSVVQLLRSLGNVPLHRIVLNPPPGTATVEDVVRFADGDEKRLVELVNGTLVEKADGLRESVIAARLIERLGNAILPNRLGYVSGEGGPFRTRTGNVRMPDVAFFPRADLPGGRLPLDPVPQIAPALAVEVLSRSNTEAEMRIKVGEYFESGVRLVWMLDPDPQTLLAYDAPARFRQLTRDDVLDCADLIPGFTVRLGELFDI